ncbi:hypothetical protein NEF87_003839 [Candidatus Lokiarchaeum ossiferum]|uniref:BAR domain-containing protein n=1 Tax=Candidatus Lokiarchaeum ossiferum TaxID=2951803 RepID=A0ABY6HYC5_9ARCH|nr:hypothetical protein NEF87_003839 [Candidatus Lokiarchaeum sp. B-35]
MGFMEKLKESFSSVAAQMKENTKQLESVIKENSELLDSHDKLSKESAEGILELKKYGEKETPLLKDAFVGLSETLKMVEGERAKMTSELRSQFLQPMKELVAQFDQLEREIKEDESAAKKLAKIKKKLDKEKAKPAEKQKPGAIEKAEADYQNAVKIAEKEHDDVIKATAAYQEQKIRKIKECLAVIVAQHKGFHQIVLSNLTDTKMYIEMIVPEQKEEVKEAIAETLENLEESLKSCDQIYTVIAHVKKDLHSVIKENMEMLNAHLKVTKESKEGINAFKDYGLKESPALGEALSSLGGSLEIIEVNRQAFVEQMNHEFIRPLKELIDTWDKLRELIKKDVKSLKNDQKIVRKLEKLKMQDPTKLKPGLLEEKEKEAASIRDASTKLHKSMLTSYQEFTAAKSKTMKSCLGSMVERNLKFHNQALNIIDNAEILVSQIDISKEMDYELDI